MSTEQKATQVHKILRDMANQLPATPLSLKAALILALWDDQEVPSHIRPMIEDL